MILVLGGTTEAKQILEKLINKNIEVLVSTAYEFAADFIPKHPLVKHTSGKLSLEELITLIEKRNIEIIVDATHPYAIEISKNARNACEKAGIKYIRIERELSQVNDLVGKDAVKRAIYSAASYEETAKLSCNLGKVIFLATGSNNAAIFKSWADRTDRKIYIRVLPKGGSREKCLAMGFAEDEIITGVGPYSYKNNYELWKRLSVEVVITKDSGNTGGFTEKIRAAEDLGIKVVVVDRPAGDVKAAKSPDEVLDIIRGIRADDSAEPPHTEFI